MKKNAFTLVELLAVLSILSILIVIFVPSIINNYSKKKEESLETIYGIIEAAARNYVIDYDINSPSQIQLEDLCKKYLECPITNPVTDEEISGYVNVENNTYEFVSN